jgi:hypothetical protein
LSTLAVTPKRREKSGQLPRAISIQFNAPPNWHQQKLTNAEVVTLRQSTAISALQTFNSCML